ncbi:SDR family oxidoreductase [Nocardia goodfellowii]|uniref:NAD(P)-dependent dehydrogenase (Short-subunit alcohol dehydrogenase family) n=1 Tax=Nocardia goodfellowii TaxID=882446 RepID=A0ABS4QJQ6_9NOCA|nr:NAD(P)-dependent oxidoreductase [Nocardia goodfellowii]MBP2191943.1 NAD(P)-dependent dehydrogenase (short-subunit alcohol dehydrogenase family) [Nocardia goodfellowii]
MTSQQQLFTDRTMVISGGSRGIGLAIARAVAQQGGNVVVLAKTAEPHPRLPGTVHTAVAELEAAGGKAVAVVGDVRNEADVRRAVEVGVDRFGGIDFCVNNAGAIATAPTAELTVKRFDLMQEINIRGTFLLTQACLPYLRQAPNPHVLNVSPPLNTSPRWLGAHPAYTQSKYGMTLLALGWAAEFAADGIAANCLWPQTYIATAAVANLPGGDELLRSARDPRIMGDAAAEILSRPARDSTGNCYVDARVLIESGATDLSGYGGGTQPIPDMFLD